MTIDELIKHLENLSVTTGGDAKVHLIERYWEMDEPIQQKHINHNLDNGRVEIIV